MSWKKVSLYRGELMGIATIMIVIFHFYENFRNDDINLFADIICDIGKCGNLGVEIFLFLSGLGCCFAYSKRKTVASFIKRRLTRVLIPYFLVAVPFWILDACCFEQGDIFQRLFNFICNLTGISIFTSNVTTFWYVILIVMMYLIFPLIYNFLKRNYSFMRFIILEVLTYLFIFFIDFEWPDIIDNAGLLISRIPDFFGGVYIGIMVQADKKIYKGIMLFFMMSVLLFMCDIDYESSILYRMMGSIEALGLLFIFISFLDFLIWKRLNLILRIIGNYSLEVYIFQVAYRKIALNLDLLQGNPLFYVFIIVLTIISAIIVHTFVNFLQTKIKI